MGITVRHTDRRVERASFQHRVEHSEVGRGVGPLRRHPSSSIKIIREVTIQQFLHQVRLASPLDSWRAASLCAGAIPMLFTTKSARRFFAFASPPCGILGWYGTPVSSRRDPELREPIPNFFVSQLERAARTRRSDGSHRHRSAFPTSGIPVDAMPRRRMAARLADMTDDDVSTGFGRGRRERRCCQRRGDPIGTFGGIARRRRPRPLPARRRSATPTQSRRFLQAALSLR